MPTELRRQTGMVVSETLRASLSDSARSGAQNPPAEERPTGTKPVSMKRSAARDSTGKLVRSSVRPVPVAHPAGTPEGRGQATGFVPSIAGSALHGHVLPRFAKPPNALSHEGFWVASISRRALAPGSNRTLARSGSSNEPQILAVPKHQARHTLGGTAAQGRIRLR